MISLSEPQMLMPNFNHHLFGNDNFLNSNDNIKNFFILHILHLHTHLSINNPSILIPGGTHLLFIRRNQHQFHTQPEASSMHP